MQRRVTILGWAVDIDKDHIVVAAYGEDTGGSEAGAIYVFSRSGSTWTEVKKIQASNPSASDYLGYGGVGIHDGTIITSSPNEDTKASDAGAAYIYSSQLVTNYYITQPGTYRADLQICGIDYKTNEVEVTGTPSDIEVFTEPETDFTASKAVLSSTSSPSYHQGGMSDNGEYYYYGQQVYKKDTGSFTYTAYGSALSTTIFEGSWSSISHDGNYIVSYYTNSTYQLHIIKNNGSTFVNHQTITSPNVSAQSQSQPQFIPGPLKHFVWVERVANTTNVTFHFYKYNSSTDNWALDFSVTNPTGLTTSSTGYWGRGGISFSKDGNYLAVSYNSNPGAAVFKVDWENQTLTLKYQNSESGYLACFLSRDAKYFYYSTGTGTTAGKMLYSANGDWEGTPTDVTSSFTNIGNLGDHTSVFSGRYIFSEKGGSARYIFKWNDLISPTLTFDNYNKLSLTNTPTYTSSKLTYGSNVYDIGTLTSDITIEKQGEYASLTFDTSSNVAYFSNVTVGAIASTMAGYEKQDQVLDAGTNAGYSNGDAAQGGYGNSIDMSADGTRMVVGNAHYTDSNGRVWLYHLESGSWVLKQTWDGGTRLGSQVAMNEAGTRVFAVSPQLDSQNLGFVRIWDYSSGAWDTSASGTYSISPGTINGEVSAVDCNKAGDVVIIGSGNSSNNTWIYRLSGGSWSSEKNFSRRGSGVSMNGDGTRCFMGDRSSHKVWESNYSGGSWGTETEIISESSFSGYWPASLSTDSAGETVCIKGGDSGNGAIYERAGNGSWSASVSGILSKTELYGTDKVALSYDGTMALFGHTRDSSGALSTGGHALLYTKSESTWTLTQTLLNPSSSQDSNDFFGGGTGLAKTVKDRFVVAAMGDDNAGTNYGAIYTYTNAIPDFISFDTYNKLSLSGITNPTSKLHVLPTGAESTTTYDIGTATNIYIESAGTYTAEMKGSDGFALDSNVVGTVATNPLGNYRSVIQTSSAYLDYGSSSDRQVTICCWYKHSNDNNGYTIRLSPNSDGSSYVFGTFRTFSDGTDRLRGWTYSPSAGSQYTYWENLPSGFDETKWNFYIFTYESNGNNHSMYLPEFDYHDNGSNTIGASWRYVFFDMPTNDNSITDFSVYEGNKATTESWRTTLYNNGQIGGAANETTDRIHYLRFHKDTIGDDIGSKNTDISSGSITPSMSLPGYSAAPSLNFDTYNKLTFTGADTGSTYKLKYESNTYDLGTISNVYIANPGTYSAEIKGATNFALSSNITGSLGTYSTLHDNVAISHTTGGGQTLVTVNNIKGNKTYKISFNKQWTDSHASYSTRLKMYIRDSSDVNIRQINSIGDYLNDPRDGILLYDAGGSFDESAMVVGTGFSVDGSAGTHTVEITGGTYGSTSSPFTLADPWYFLLTMSTSDVITGKFFVGDTEVISHFLTRPQSGTSGYSIGETGNKFVFEFWDTATISGVNMTVEEYNPAPKFDFDTYNKLTFTGLESGSTSTLKYGSNTYDIGTASNVYISEQGTYNAESKGTTTFALTSNVVGAMNTPFTAAFHYGAFSASDYSSAYSTVGAAATAGFVYSDTTPATYTWGTLNSVDTSTTGQTGYSWTPTSDITADVLMVAGGGSGGAAAAAAGGGAGGLVFTDSTTISGPKTIVVGAGGIAPTSYLRGVNGYDSFFTGIGTAIGGGGGGSWQDIGNSAATQSGNDGGSGGGSGHANLSGVVVGTGVPSQGFNGGASSGANDGGGGGGSGGIGGNGSGGNGGAGGIGTDLTTTFGIAYGDDGWFASGGGGGARSLTPGTASKGGGSSSELNDSANDAMSHTGGGGGAAGSGSYGGSGGSGIVIIRSGPSATPPSLTHDGYKLVVSGITPTSTTLKYGSNTYEIGSATNIYVENTGDYSAEIGSAADFALVSNTVSGTLKTVEPTLSGGYFFGHALTYDGKLYGWGENSSGQAGVGTSSDITVPTLCTGIPQGEVVSIWDQCVSSQNRWAKTRDGKIWVTGEGTQYSIPGQTGDQTSFIDVTSYFGDQSLTANNITQISGQGSGTTMALTETGNVWTWGTHSSSFWNLGQGTGASSSNTPKQITFGGVTDNISRVKLGNAHGVALDTDGDVWFWGKIWVNGSGVDYPQATLSDAQKSPHEIMTSNNIVGVSSTYFTIYAWQSDGTYYALGQDSAGQIGDGTATAGGHTSWQKVDYFSAKNITINEIYGGAYHVFADTSDGYYCWGQGNHGNLGNGSTGNLASPTKWTNVSNIKVFSSGSYECPYAITEDGKYYAWGNGTNNARGDNTTGDITYPKYIDTLPNILAPSFEFDGYDKVLASGTFVYEFYVSVKASGGSGLHYVNINQMSSSTLTLKTSMVTVHVPSYSGSVANMFDGSNSTTYSINDPNHEVGIKLWTLVTDKELADLTFVIDRPVYMPGWRITCNGETVLNDTTNGGTSLTPSPATFTKTLSPITSLTKYTKGTTTYDAGKASIVTVSDPGTYDAQLKKSGVFSLKSATIPETKTSGLYTWAFHHGNFDNAYGDGDILTARDNGRFYADTPSYTGDIGTITPTLDPYPVTYTFPFTSAYPVASDYPQISSFTNGNTGSGGTTIANGYMTMNGNGDGNDRMPKWETTNSFLYMSVGFDAYFDRSSVTNGTIFGGQETGGRFMLQYTTSNNTLYIYHAKDGAGGGSTYGSTTIADATWYNIKIVFDSGDGVSNRNVKVYLDNVLEIDHALNSDWNNYTSINSWYMGNKTSSNYGMGGMRIKNFDVYEGLWPVTEDVSKTTYTFTPASTLTANVLMVAGGGGGGQTSGGSAGGGGAGGLLYYANQSITIGTKTIVVGNGGANHVNGNDTTFTLLTTTFGGGRGATAGETGGNGGSGGGTSHNYPTSPGTGVSDQGNAGGNGGNDTYRTGGGGGGAGGVGGNASTSSQLGGVGGIGLNYSNVFGSFYGESGWFAGGGAGCSQSTATPAVGGIGGGGYSSTSVSTANALSGQSHTGGGGGGAGGDGGSGIVLLQTNVATPNVNSEVKIPEPHYHVLIEKHDDTQFSHLPNGIGSGNNHTGGSIVPNIPRADGSVSNVYYATSTEYFYAEQAGSLVSTVEGVFYPIEQQRYNNILEIGHNSTHDVEFEMAADGTAKLYRSNGGTHLASGTVKCFTVGKWHHIALTLDANRNAVGYVNGYPVVSATYASAILPGSRNQMCLYRTGVDGTFRKFLMYYFKTYNSVLNHKQIMQLAGAAGLGPKLEYDGLNAINVVNTEPGSGTEITIYESNVNDTSNLYVVACNTSSYLLSNAGTYYAQIKGTDTFTITRPLTVTDDHFPLYQYPPVATGTLSNGTFSIVAGSGNQSYFTVSGAETGNGTYSSYSSVAAATDSDSSGVFTNGIGTDSITYTNTHKNYFRTSSETSNVDLVVVFPSAKTIRKYVLYPTDTNAPTSPYEPGTSVDPTLSGGTNEDNLSRPKSWVLYGYTQSTGWVSLDTVTNQPPSIYGDVHSISSPASYDQYKLSISENNGSSSYIQLGEWQLWGDA
jgi:alpha-tubulin suppressor-like RCC1 family protein